MLHRIRVCKTWIHKFAIAFLVSALSLCIVQRAAGQTNAATLNATVTDASGALIPQAAVTLENTLTGTSRTGATNDSGQFTMPVLDPGSYALRVEKQGFAISEVKDITLHTADNVALVIKLKVGRADQTVTVSGASLTTDSPGVSVTVTREFIENMPLNGQSFQDLIQLAPGAVSSSSVDKSKQGYYSIDGQRTDSNNYTVDGVSANLGGSQNSSVSGSIGAGLSGSSPSQTVLGTTQSLVSVDALQEFTIQTSGYTAEYGRNPGGQFQFTTRSGTNEIHGSLFEFLRNTVFDANSSFNNYNHTAQTAEHQNDFGGTVGGPLIVPKLYNGKDRTFYFVSYEGLRLLLPDYENEYVPTQAFRQWSSPNSQPYLNALPLPSPGEAGDQDACNVPDPKTGQPTACDALFSYGYSTPNNLDNISVRFDQVLGKHLHAFVRYADTPSSETIGAELSETYVINTHAWTAGLTANITNNLLDDLRFNYSHDGEEIAYAPKAVGGSVPWARSLLIPPAYDSAYSIASVSLQIPGTPVSNEQLSGGDESTIQHQYQVLDSVTWTRGRHNLKFGADWRRLTPTSISSPYDSFIGITTLANFQQGSATDLQISVTAPGQPVFDNLSLYAQDHWKISPRLSIDYGLRWEFNPPPGPANGKYPAVLTSNNLDTATLAELGTQPYKTDYHSFAPRFGFVWNVVPSASHSFTVRGGFGIFFDTGQSVIGNAYGSYPFGATKPEQFNVALPASSAALAPPSLNVPLTPPFSYNVFATDSDISLPYTEQWNLSLDEALNAKNTLTASYVGNNGRKLLYTQTFFSLPNPNFPEGLQFTNNAAQSSYNSLQVQDTGRIAKGLDLVASFTWAHALDNASNSFSFESPLYGNSDYDLRRALNLALNYQTPTANWSHWTESVTHGWLLANRFSVQSGYPINILQTTAVTPNGAQEQYSPDLVPGVPIYLHGSAADLNGQSVPGNWRLNAAAFECVPTTKQKACSGTPIRQGTLGRNYIRTPSFWAWNVALQRSFPIYERLHLNFRIDAFNILNHPNLNLITNSFPSSTFGESNGAAGTIGSSNALYGMGAARSLQFSLHLQF